MELFYLSSYKLLFVILVLSSLHALAQPKIMSFNPARGPAGTMVTLSGSGFDPVPSNNWVFFGSTKATVTGGSASSLTVSVPTGITSDPIKVFNRTTSLTGYTLVPFTPTFINPFGSGIPGNFYRPKTDFATPGDVTYSVAFGDLDGDGKPEMVSVNESLGLVSVMRNTAAAGTIMAGSFAGRVDFATAPLPRKVAVWDWDNDGKLDILVLSPASNTVSVLRNTTTAAGSITAASFAASRIDLNIGQYISDFAVADLDVDGKPDLLLTLPYSMGVAVVMNTNVTFGVTYFSMPCGEYPRAVAVSDLDGDGKQDIVVANERSNTVSVIRNRSGSGLLTNISFAPKVDFAAGNSPVDLALRDADGDGKPEIVVANFASSNLSVLQNTSIAGNITTASFAPAVNFATGINPYAMAIGDADGDGKLDLLTANTASNSVSVLRNTATAGSITASSFAGKVDFDAGIYTLGLALGDLDGDGIVEVAAANAGSGNISVFKVDAPSSPSVATTSAITLSMQVYPNPTKGAYAVQLEHVKALTATIEVLTESGLAVEKRVVNLDDKTTRHTVRLSLNQHPAGLYYVKVTSAHGVQVTKLLVQP
ncbi:MAG: VCBS repeat-containing protein [Williamsia sp.]|nr:VCBS repeat-containing protein [Williamsia sp.]